METTRLRPRPCALRRPDAILSCLAIALLGVTLPACIIARDASPSLETTVQVANQYNHRGMVQVDDDVVQGDLKVDMPASFEGSFRLFAFGNMDLHDDTGDAWFPNGNDGRFSEIDLGGSYTRSVGDFDLTAGTVTYVLPDGDNFPNGARGQTTEIFFAASTEVIGFEPSIRANIYVDEADGQYILTGVARGIDISSDFGARLGVDVGYNDSDHARWTYGTPTGGGGFSDLRGVASLFYTFDERTLVSLTLNASTILDDETEEWLDLIDIDTTNVWATIGVTWFLP